MTGLLLLLALSVGAPPSVEAAPGPTALVRALLPAATADVEARLWPVDWSDLLVLATSSSDPRTRAAPGSLPASASLSLACDLRPDPSATRAARARRPTHRRRRIPL